MVSKYKIHSDARCWALMTMPELEWLAGMASTDRMHIAEIGVYLGGSTRVMNDNAGKDTTILCVDNFSYDASNQQSFKDNVGYGNPECKVITLLHSTSLGAAEWCKSRGLTFDFTFIDADHSYEAVRDDIKAWLPLTTGILAGHDYSDEARPYDLNGTICKNPGVVQAVDEAFGDRVHRGPGSIWYVTL
jgi:hypothetical protein